MLEDREVLTRFRQGDRATLAAVYRRFSPDIAKLARHGFSFRSGAEVHRFFGFREAYEQQDLVQEVFIRAFGEKARLAYDGLTPFESYLKGILRNLVIDEARRRRAALNAFGGPPRSTAGDDDERDLVEAAPSEGDDPEVAAQRKRVRDAMGDFVGTLPLREQRLVELRFVEGLHQDQVAHRMKVSRQTVRTLEGRVRKRLQKHLRTRGVLEGGLAAKGAAGMVAMVPGLLALPFLPSLLATEPLAHFLGGGHA